jgi:hypothetical protein
MLRTTVVSSLLVAALFATATPPAPAAASCAAGDVTISGATLQSVSADGSLSDVHVAVTVKNGGSALQPSNTLQSVATYQAGNKVGSKGIPPLRPGQVYTFVYSFQRAADAAPRSTRLIFRLVGDNAPGAMCVDAAQRIRLSV